MALAQKPTTCALATVGGVTRCSVNPGMPVNTTLSWQLTYLQKPHSTAGHGLNTEVQGGGPQYLFHASGKLVVVMLVLVGAVR